MASIHFDISIPRMSPLRRICHSNPKSAESYEPDQISILKARHVSENNTSSFVASLTQSHVITDSVVRQQWASILALLNVGSEPRVGLVIRSVKPRAVHGTPWMRLTVSDRSRGACHESYQGQEDCGERDEVLELHCVPWCTKDSGVDAMGELQEVVGWNKSYIAQRSWAFEG